MHESAERRCRENVWVWVRKEVVVVGGDLPRYSKRATLNSAATRKEGTRLTSHVGLEGSRG